MRKLAIGIVVLAAVWAAYWAIAARSLENGISSWLEERRGAGWVSEYSEVKTSGFPFDFKTEVHDLELADPNTGVAWKAPLFRIFAPSYKPTRITATWPEKQTFATPLEKIDIKSEQMVGAIAFQAGPSLTLDHSSFELANVTLKSSAGWTSHLDAGTFTTSLNPERANTHDIFFEATAWRPPLRVLSLLDPVRALPDNFQTMRIALTVSFDAPWDRHVIENKRPRITYLHLKDLQGTWGRLDLRAAGKLTVDQDGLPTGRIVVRATNWRDMLKVGVSSGLVPQNVSGTIENLLAVLAGLSGKQSTLDAPLVFENGLVSFGPIPLGPAPRLVLR